MGVAVEEIHRFRVHRGAPSACGPFFNIVQAGGAVSVPAAAGLSGRLALGEEAGARAFAVEHGRGRPCRDHPPAVHEPDRVHLAREALVLGDQQHRGADVAQQPA